MTNDSGLHCSRCTAGAIHNAGAPKRQQQAATERNVRGLHRRPTRTTRTTRQLPLSPRSRVGWRVRRVEEPEVGRYDWRGRQKGELRVRKGTSPSAAAHPRNPGVATIHGPIRVVHNNHFRP